MMLDTNTKVDRKKRQVVNGDYPPVFFLFFVKLPVFTLVVYLPYKAIGTAIHYFIRFIRAILIVHTHK